MVFIDDLIVACESGDVDTVYNIVSLYRYDINTKDIDGYTGLHFAASAGHSEVVKVLLEHGADANFVNTSKGQTPLHCACNASSLAIVQLLLEHGAIESINTRTNSFVTPLHCAIHANKKDSLAIVKLLLRNGALPDDPGVGLTTPLMLACQQNNTFIAGELLRARVNINAKDDTNASVLHYVATNGNIGILSMLLKEGVIINQPPVPNDATMPALHLAARGGHLSVCKALIEAGANVHARCPRQRTALHIAALNGSESVTSLLLRNGADVDATDSEGITPLAYAANEGKMDVTRLLIDMGVDPNVGAGKQKWAPLHLATKEGREKTVELLVTRDQTNINILDAKKRTALHWAAFRGDMSTALRLLEHGADASLPDADGRPAGVIAAARGFAELSVVIHTRAGTRANSSKKVTMDDLGIYWVDDKAAKHCMKCAKNFSLKNRRHHCRECRGLYCGSCTTKKFKAPHRLAGVRVCDQCYDRVSTQMMQTK